MKRITIREVKQATPKYHDYVTQNVVLKEYNKQYKIYNLAIEDFINFMSVKMEFSNRDEARYVQSEDIIQLPFKSKFKRLISVTREQNYYSTLFHEIGHWTGHESRLKRKSLSNYSRDLKNNCCGGENEVLEEITAELTANLLMNFFKLQKSPNYLSLCFINKELSYLDKRMQEQLYNKATKQATRAYNFILKQYKAYLKHVKKEQSR